MSHHPNKPDRFEIRQSTLAGRHNTVGLDESEFVALHEAKEGVFVALAVEEKYGYIVGNFREFELALLEHSLDGMLRFEAEWSDLASNIKKFNRLLVNLLTTCRLYHDQVDREVSQICGRDSEERQRLKAARSAEFDDSSSYRIMEGLRNYIQHQGLPLRRITLDMSRALECPAEAEWRTLPLLDGVALVADGGFKKRIADDLSAMGMRIDVRLLMREYVQSMARIHQVVRSVIKIKVTEWAQLVLNALERYEKTYQTRKHIEVVSPCGDQVIQRFSVFEEPVKELNELNRTLAVAGSIAQHFVSNRLARSGPSVDDAKRIAIAKKWEQLSQWHENTGTD